MKSTVALLLLFFLLSTSLVLEMPHYFQNISATNFEGNCVSIPEA